MPRAARTVVVSLVTALALGTGTQAAFAATRASVPPPPGEGIPADGTPGAPEFDPWDDSAMIEDTQPHVGGYVANTERYLASPSAVTTGIPAAVDLRPYAPAVGDQGSIGQCVAWTISRNLMGWYANRTGGVDSPYAPLFLYMRNVVAGGAPSRGLNPDTVLANVQANGVDSQDDYFQGTSNYKVAPTSAEIANAGNYKITGWTRLWSGANQGDNAETAIKQALANNQPVAIGFNVFQDFMDLGPHSLYSTTSGTSLGGHMITAFGYDADGIYVRNQWGTGWGNDGDAHLSWSFVETVVSGAYTINGIATPSSSVTVAPQVTALSTTKGPAGTSVTVTGAGLAKATAVRFGGASATFSKTVTNGVTRLVAAAPRGVTGVADVTVTNAAGTSDGSGTADDFSFTQAPPALTAISPSSVSRDGGTTITLTGTDLAGATSVKVGTSIVAPASVSDTTVTFVAPAHTTGNVPVTVTTGGGTTGYRYLLYVASGVPTLSKLTPATGVSTAVQTTVVVTGTNLVNIRSVKLGTTALGYTVVSATTLKVFVKKRATGSASLVVTTAGGTSNALTYTAKAPAKPAITSLSPAIGLTTTSTAVVINGGGFTGATRVAIGGRAVSFTRVSDSQLKFTAPARRAGKVTVVVTGPGGVSKSATFTYSASVRPLISSLAPAQGSTAKMTKVSVTGRYLSKVTIAYSAGKRASFQRVSDTRLTLTLVRHAAGKVSVQVRSAAGYSGKLTFTYVK
ncbi:IPT/TIG domain-containing protein [Symbioplanes lichenis]|uniref:IPT/TIG domain-containing protein n=1 Tax=Symbioplanes lichenis TaxID=1629072 RepID=UPI002738C180|nr:IPT/TIG domain-containing protein [Actinoplanes lichenis]